MTKPNTDAGRILIMPKGEYDDEKQYYLLDLVFYDGRSWIACEDTRGTSPSDDSFVWFKATDTTVVNNLITEKGGYALDARQGKELLEMINSKDAAVRELVSSEIERLDEELGGRIDVEKQNVLERVQNVNDVLDGKIDNIDNDLTLELAKEVVLRKSIESRLVEEISERQRNDDVICARMDTFTKLPSGSTSGDAELADIRVGADGKGYNSAGDAVRGQFSQLSESIVDISKLIDDNEAFIKNTWVNGSYVSGVYKSQYKYLVCTKDIITPNNKITLLIDNGFRVRSLRFDESGAYVSQSAWATGTLDLNAGNHYQLIVGRETSDESEIADVLLFSHSIHYIASKFEDVISNKNIKSLFKPFVDLINEDVANTNVYYEASANDETLIPAVFVRGSIAIDGKFIREGYEHRVATAHPFVSNKRLVYTVKDGYMVRLLQYENGSVFANESGITGEFVIFPNIYYSVIIYKTVEDTSKIADINEYVSAVKLIEKTDLLLIPCKFINGSRDANGNLITTGYMRRISSSDINSKGLSFSDALEYFTEKGLILISSIGFESKIFFVSLLNTFRINFISSSSVFITITC